MSAHYAEMWRLLQATERFEKYASESELAAGDLASTCSRTFETFLEKAASEYDSDGTPAGVALQACSFAEDLYAASQSLSEKTASEADADHALEQLATVAYVDSVLKTASESMTGEDYANTQHLRLLGREYGVQLLKTLVG
jgi:hypothetical protein